MDTPLPDTGFDESFWRLYQKAMGKKVSQAMAQKAQRGDVPGQLPLGYRCGLTQDGFEPVIESKTGPLVRQAFQVIASGASFRETLALVKQQGLVSKRGNFLSLSSLHHILANPFYAGYIRYKGQLYQGHHPALVSKSLFQRVQRRLKQRRC